MFAESATHGRSSDGEVVIETRELVKRFGEREALKGVSFDAHRGELLAVIGPNGAGKTTLLSILAGIRRQDGGTVSRPPGEIGWIPQQAALYRRLTVIENLRLFAHLEKVPDTGRRGRGDARPDRPRASAATTRWGRCRAGTSSGSTSPSACSRARWCCCSTSQAPGLDPRQRERLWEFVLGLAGGGTTVIFSTHNIAEAERYGQRLLVLADGEALFDGTSHELHAAVPESGARDFEQAFVAFLRDRGH